MRRNRMRSKVRGWPLPPKSVDCELKDGLDLHDLLDICERQRVYADSFELTKSLKGLRSVDKVGGLRHRVIVPDVNCVQCGAFVGVPGQVCDECRGDPRETKRINDLYGRTFKGRGQRTEAQRQERKRRENAKA